MTSKERHEARYQRRVQNRLEKKQKALLECDNFETVFSLDNLYHGYELCRRNVGWKASTQKYKTNAIYNIVQTYHQLNEGKFKSSGFCDFTIIERGKLRHIRSVHISERVVQRTLCDRALVPALSRSFIYDNGACMKGKGIDFALNRLSCHLQRYYRHYGYEGYALVFDFSKFFDHITHDVLKAIITKLFTDKRLIDLIFMLIDAFGEVGLGLGSQISQICALAYPSALDHYVKEKLHIKYYGRYMDDAYLLYPNKEYLKYCLEKITDICTSLGIVLNSKKTQIIKISQGITFLKERYILTHTGKIIRTAARKSITKMRRKLKIFKGWVDNDTMQLKDVNTSYASWKGHMARMNSYRTIQSTDALYNSLFIGDSIYEIP